MGQSKSDRAESNEHVIEERQHDLGRNDDQQLIEKGHTPPPKMDGKARLPTKSEGVLRSLKSGRSSAIDEFNFL